MAVAAEHIDIWTIEGAESPLFEVVPEQQYVDIESIPELHFVRQRAQQTTEEILEEHRQHLREGEFDQVPIPVDALGTGSKVIAAKGLYGEESDECRQLRAGLSLDCLRLYAEAARKMTYEYFPPIRHEWNQETEEYESNGQSILAMTGSGLSPIISEPEELDYRRNDHIQETTHKAIGCIGLSQTVKTRAISECPNWAIAAYKRKSKAGYGGYVPEIEKLMVRDIVFDPISKDRYMEQVGLPGLYITHEVIVEALRRRGIAKDIETKTDVHGTHMLHDDDLFEFVALLDEVASEVSREEIFMGEILAPGKMKNYGEIREQAIERQEKLVEESECLAEYVLELEANHTDRWVAVKLVEEHVKKRLMGIADRDNSRAAEIFDEKTAEGLREVAYLRSAGLTNEAQNRFREVEEEAPSPGYCGAGSCGLEEVEPNSTSG